MASPKVLLNQFSNGLVSGITSRIDRLAVRLGTVLQAQQVQVYKDTYLAVAEQGLATGAKHFVLYNDAASGKLVRVRKAWIANATEAAVIGLVARFKLQRLTAVTGGTPSTIVPVDTSNPAIPGTITAVTAATSIAGASTIISCTMSSDEAQVQNDLVNLWEDRYPDTQPLTCRPGQGLAFVQGGLVGITGTVEMGFLFTVEDT